MLFWICLAICAMIGAICFKNTPSYNEPWANGILSFVLSMMLGSMIVFLFAAGVFQHYETKSVKPLVKRDGVYAKFIPENGSIHALVNYPRRQVNINTEIGDDDSSEVNIYYGKPRVVKRCSEADSWVLPFGWSYGMNGCDTNIYIPYGEVK